MSTDAPAEEPPFTPEQVKAIMHALMVEYGNYGVHPLRVGASIMVEGTNTVYEARDLATATPAELSKLKWVCHFCGPWREWDSEAALRAAHVDLAGCRARHEMHLISAFHKDVGLFSNGKRMDEP